MEVSGNTRTQSGEGGRATEMWGEVRAHTEWLPARSRRGHLWGEGQEVLKGRARQAGSMGHRGVCATEVATWTLLTSACGGKCTQDGCHTSLQSSLSFSQSQLHHHFCFMEQYRPYIGKWKMRKGQGPFCFSTVVWYVWYSDVQGIWPASEVILLAGGLQVKRLVCIYENRASDIKLLLMLAGTWSQFRFPFLRENPLALMTKVSKMSQLLFALLCLLAGASGLWDFFFFFLVIVFNPPANGTPGRAFQLHTISFISSIIKPSISWLGFFKTPLLIAIEAFVWRLECGIIWNYFRL